jgi:hypothetical protein
LARNNGKPPCSASAPAKGIVAARVKNYHVKTVSRVVKIVQQCLNGKSAVAKVVFAWYVRVYGYKKIFTARLHSVARVKEKAVSVLYCAQAVFKTQRGVFHLFKSPVKNLVYGKAEVFQNSRYVVRVVYRIDKRRKVCVGAVADYKRELLRRGIFSCLIHRNGIILLGGNYQRTAGEDRCKKNFSVHNCSFLCRKKQHSPFLKNICKTLYSVWFLFWLHWLFILLHLFQKTGKNANFCLKFIGDKSFLSRNNTIGGINNAVSFFSIKHRMTGNVLSVNSA